MKSLRFFTLLCVFFSSLCGTAQTKDESIVSNPIIDSVAIKRIDTLSNYIISQFYKRNYDQTIEFGELALDLSKQSNYYKKYAAISSHLGNSYLQLEDSLRAKEVFSESVQLAIKQKDTLRQIISEIDFANFYALRDENTSKKSAIKLYKEIIPLVIDVNDNSTLLTLYSNISELYLDLEYPDLAEKYIGRSERLLNDPNIFKGYLGSAALNQARFLTQKNLFSQAEPHFNQSLKIFEEMNYMDGIIDVYKYSIENALGRSNYQDAFETQQKLDRIELEKYKADKIEAIQTVVTKFKLDEIKTELQEQKFLTSLNEEKAKRETTIFWVRIASIIALLFLSFVVFSSIKKRKLVSSLILKNKQYLDEKKRSEELYNAKSKLFSNITHELRTPMYGIIGISNSLMDNHKFSEEEKDLKSLKFSADYLLALVNNILHFNKLETNEIDILRVSSFDIRTLVWTAVETSRFLSEDHPNTYHVTIDDSIPNILLGDHVKLSQILINLIGNASKFTSDGDIFITLQNLNVSSSSSIKIKFTIKDTGIGVAENEISTLFDQYTQSAERQNFMGTGLGLPIVSRLLEQQNSILNFTSELSKGTTVNFDLNFNLSENKETSKNYNYTAASRLSDQKILVVDDNKINQLVTKKFIQRYGATCILAGSGKRAIELIKSEPADLILMDINMPEMNGFETTKIIRTFNKDIPIIALTAVEKEKVVGDNSFHLMNDIIIKPYSNEVFIDTVLKNIKNDALIKEFEV